MIRYATIVTASPTPSSTRPAGELAQALAASGREASSNSTTHGATTPSRAAPRTHDCRASTFRSAPPHPPAATRRGRAGCPRSSEPPTSRAILSVSTIRSATGSARSALSPSRADARLPRPTRRAALERPEREPGLGPARRRRGRRTASASGTPARTPDTRWSTRSGHAARSCLRSDRARAAEGATGSAAPRARRRRGRGRARGRPRRRQRLGNEAREDAHGDRDADGDASETRLRQTIPQPVQATTANADPVPPSGARGTARRRAGGPTPSSSPTAIVIAPAGRSATGPTPARVSLSRCTGRSPVASSDPLDRVKSRVDSTTPSADRPVGATISTTCR